MKNLKRTFFVLVMLMTLALSCKEDSHELGPLLDKSAIQYSVTQDLAKDPGGNTVIMTNNTPGTVSMWDYGTGRSNRQADTVHFAFKGDYVIKFSALTAGGVVDLDPVTVTVTEDNLNYVNDPLWTALSGGVGNEKTWLLDIDENGVSKYFTSPIYFAGSSFTYGGVCTAPGADCWSWFPEWKGNTWIMPQGDYGSMTFNLKGGPFVTVDQKIIGDAGVHSGTYFLDVNTKILTTTDVLPLRNGFTDNDFTKGLIISLNENSMQIAFQNTTKAEYEIFNYISKDYADNWVPPVTGDPNFDNGDQGEALAVSSSKTWKFALEVPYNWADLNGSFLNPWSSRADIIATGWAPYGDADVANIDDDAITFSADGTVTVRQDDGSTTTGTYSVDEPTNMITFSGVTPSWVIADWVSATTTEENKWKIVKVEKDPLTSEVVGMWLGKRDPVKSEYMVFHFVIR